MCHIYMCVKFCSGTAKLEEACDLYIRAGNAFKMGKKWSGITDCLVI